MNQGLVKQFSNTSKMHRVKPVGNSSKARYHAVNQSIKIQQKYFDFDTQMFKLHTNCKKTFMTDIPHTEKHYEKFTHLLMICIHTTPLENIIERPARPRARRARSRSTFVH